MFLGIGALLVFFCNLFIFFLLLLFLLLVHLNAIGKERQRKRMKILLDKLKKTFGIY